MCKFKVDLEALILGTISSDRLKTYQDDELMFMCKSITWKAKNLHERIEETAAEMGVDIKRSKLLQKSNRVDFTEKDIENMNTSGRRTQIKELMVVLRKWGDVDRWKSKRM